MMFTKLHKLLWIYRFSSLWETVSGRISLPNSSTFRERLAAEGPFQQGQAAHVFFGRSTRLFLAWFVSGDPKTGDQKLTKKNHWGDFSAKFWDLLFDSTQRFQHLVAFGLSTFTISTTLCTSGSSVGTDSPYRGRAKSSMFLLNFESWLWG